MKEQKEKISLYIKKGISRCIERMQIEGISILKLPEQFAALVCLELWHEKDFTEEQLILLNIQQIEEKLEICRHERTWWHILKDVSLIKKPDILQEIWRLVRLVCDEYTECSFEDVSSLGVVMECMLETISKMGNKECFFTPPAIAEMMISLLAPERGCLWDPACGSGTFLCKSLEKVSERQIFIYGTDVNEQMIKLTGINLFFHGKNADVITAGETVEPKQSEKFWETYEAGIRLEEKDAFEVEKKFDYIIANPLVSSVFAFDYSEKGHFVKTKALHLQFLQHIMTQLKENGRAAILVNESLLFSNKTAEHVIREVLVKEYGLRTVISLPQGVFAPYTNAKSSILLFKGVGQASPYVLFYEMEHLGYTLDKNRTICEKNDIPDVIQKEMRRSELYQEWENVQRHGVTYNADGVQVPTEWNEQKVWFAKREQIEENDCILLPGRYRPRSEEREQELEEPIKLLEQLIELEQDIQERLERIKGDMYEG